MVVQGKDQKTERLTTTSTAQTSDQTAAAAETVIAAEMEDYDAKLKAKKAKDDYIDNFTLSHDRRHKGPCRNVDDIRRPIQTEDSYLTITLVQYNENSSRR